MNEDDVVTVRIRFFIDIACPDNAASASKNTLLPLRNLYMLINRNVNIAKQIEHATRIAAAHG